MKYFANIDSDYSYIDMYLSYNDVNNDKDLTLKYGRTKSIELNVYKLNKYCLDNGIFEAVALSAPINDDKAIAYPLDVNYLPYFVISKFKPLFNNSLSHWQGIPSAASLHEKKLKTLGHLSKFFNPFLNVSKKINFPSFKKIAKVDDLKKIAANDVKEIKINYNKVQFEFIFDNKVSDFLVILNQSAITRSMINLPVYHRWSQSINLNAKVITVNDPTLYASDDLNAGWFVGTKDSDYANHFVSLIKKIALLYKIPVSNIIFYGGSAGGFSALSQSSLLPGSLAISDIAQVDLNSYQYKSEIDKLVASFPELSTELFKHRINLINRFSRFAIPRFVFIQNEHDRHHVSNHMIPLIKFINSAKSDDVLLNGKQFFYTYDYFHPIRGGHSPFPNIIPLINKIIENIKQGVALDNNFGGFGLRNVF